MSDNKVKMSRLEKINQKLLKDGASNPLLLQIVDCWYWSYYNKIKLRGIEYELDNHWYQGEWLRNKGRRRVYRKGAQMGGTEAEVLRTLHGLIYGQYPQGVLWLFPTREDVTDFSKGRFQTLISENPCIGSHVSDTDAANIKKIGKSMLYLRGAKSSGLIEDTKETSSQLKSVPVDKVITDEVDEMSPAMVAMAMERMSHSTIQERVSISTPTIPGYGIDKLYEESDQRVWMIKCRKCNEYTCLEMEFPECIVEKDGRYIRLCKKCRDQEIFTRDGVWVAKHPSRNTPEDSTGWWISQLNSAFINPGLILKMYNNPVKYNTTLAEVYNSKLGMPYIATENRLNKNMVFACCGQDAMRMSSERNTAMGVDVGETLHVVIGYKTDEQRFKIIRMERISSFEELHDLVIRYQVKIGVIDMEPETRKAREFKDSHYEFCKIMLCDYQERLKTHEKKNEVEGLLTVRRTETCDIVHNMIDKQLVELPRRNPEVEEYARQMCNIAKIIKEDDYTKSRIFRYKGLGDDHYFHATNYFQLACRDYLVSSDYHDNNYNYAGTGSYNPYNYI